jgi:hypothetical protein
MPATAFLRKYQEGSGFADCYVVQIDRVITQAGFVTAFYTTGLFKIERRLLHWLVNKPATDDDAQRLADGSAATFSAWQVEAQDPDQLLLADFTGRTRSWLMAVPSAQGRGSAAATTSRNTPGTTSGTTSLTTSLYFGSAVLPLRSRTGEAADLGWSFHALLGFHKLYSRLLLAAACRRLRA